MKRRPVRSRMLVSIGYDGALSILEIEFEGGAVYQYFGVPRHIHDDLMTAASHGTYVNDHIKGTYPYRKLA